MKMQRTDELLRETYDLIDAAGAAGHCLRLIGGLGVRARCPSSARPPFERAYSDADCVASGGSSALQAFFAGQGWVADREFNMYNGDGRLIFSSPQGMKIDVFVGAFSMCHEFRFDGRMPPEGYAVYPADLLLTKLQIHEINDKDLSDAACVILDCEPRGDDSGINADYMASVCSSDWGIYRTVMTNLEKTGQWASSKIADTSVAMTVGYRLGALMGAIEDRGKSLAWRCRAMIGTKMRWYAEVEEVDR